MTSTPDTPQRVYEARQKWFSEAHNSQRMRPAAFLLSSQGLLLQYDVQRAFCAGAWLSVIVLAQAVIEASIRDIETHDYETNAKNLFAGSEALERVRTLRNEILHPQKPGTPSKVWTVAGGDYIACHASMETDAKLAVEEMFRAVYANRET